MDICFFDTQGQRDGMAQQDIDGIKYGQCATCAKEFEDVLLEMIYRIICLIGR
jgi:hypothetical protein